MTPSSPLDPSSCRRDGALGGARDSSAPIPIPGAKAAFRARCASAAVGQSPQFFAALTADRRRREHAAAVPGVEPGPTLASVVVEPHSPARLAAAAEQVSRERRNSCQSPPATQRIDGGASEDPRAARRALAHRGGAGEHAAGAVVVVGRRIARNTAGAVADEGDADVESHASRHVDVAHQHHADGRRAAEQLTVPRGCTRTRRLSVL